MEQERLSVFDGSSSARSTTILMTLIESPVVIIWFFVFRGSPAQYVPAINSYLFTDLIVAAPILILGLTIENTVALNRFAQHLDKRYSTAFGLAVTEAVIWSLWLALVVRELFSPRGIGPALIVATILFILQHAIEMQVTSQATPSPFTPGVISTSVVEATAATVLWVLMTAGEPLFAIIAVALLIGVEHEARLVNTRTERDARPLLSVPSRFLERKTILLGVITGITTLGLLNWIHVTQTEPSPYTVRWLLLGAAPLSVALFLGNALPIATKTNDWQLVRDTGPLAIVQVIVLTQWGIAIGSTLYGAAGPVGAGVVLAVLLSIYYALEGRTINSRPILDVHHLLAGGGLAVGLSGYTVLQATSFGIVIGPLVLAIGVAVATTIRL